MKKILALDISSSTIGWSLLESDDITIDLIEYGHIKPPNKAKAAKSGNGFSYRLNQIMNDVTSLVTTTNPDIVIVEDYAKKFSFGRSSANTIIVLATTNETVSLACFRVMNKEVVRIPVLKLRSIISKQYNKDIKDKKNVLDLSKQLFNNFVTSNNRAGNIKEECYDEADSIIVGLGYHILNK